MTPTTTHKSSIGLNRQLAPPAVEARRLVARVVDAVKVYGRGDNEVRALDGVTVGFEAGRFTAIMGPSGSGKSTLMHIAAGLDTLTSGVALIGETDLAELDDRKLTQLRRDRIGFIFQSFNLVPTLTAAENIKLPARLAGRRPDAVSGGHTQLMHVADVGRYELLGETIDDAAGEAFDKSAKLLGLSYPGGPALARLAEFGDASTFMLPRPLLHSGTLDFSFAGLKTAVRTQVLKLGSNVCEQDKAHLAASTQQAIVDVLVRKTLAALRQTQLKRVVVAGGVGANARLRQQLNAECEQRQIRVHYPELALCTDNGAMIALAAAMRLQRGIANTRTDHAFNVLPRWPLVAA